jgi:hypothetical protein
MCHNCSVGGLTSAQAKMDPKRLLELERRMAAPREQPIVNNAVDDASLDAVQKEWQASESYSAALTLSRLSINGDSNCSIHHMGLRSLRMLRKRLVLDRSTLSKLGAVALLG